MPKPTPRLLECAAVLTVFIIGLFAAGCDTAQPSPKIIVADGQTYLACQGSVWFGGEGNGNTFKVSFTDAAGLGHMLRGIKTLEVSDIPKMIDAPMPTGGPIPMVTSDGKPVVEGQIYLWDEGRQARFRNGTWEPVQIPNNACQRK